MGTQGETIKVFCGRLLPRLVATLALQVGDRGAAEDLAQEALARTWERWDEVAMMASPEAWTYRVAFNLALSRGRRRGAEHRANRRSVAGSAAGSGVGSPSATGRDADLHADRHQPDRHADRHEADRLVLRDALARLPPRQRAAVVLRFYGQFSVAETAQAMDCAPGTVKSLTSQGLASLRALLVFDEPVVSVDSIDPVDLSGSVGLSGSVAPAEPAESVESVPVKPVEVDNA